MILIIIRREMLSLHISLSGLLSVAPDTDSPLLIVELCVCVSMCVDNKKR